MALTFLITNGIFSAFSFFWLEIKTLSPELEIYSKSEKSTINESKLPFPL